jgi:hypothetical protein
LYAFCTGISLYFHSNDHSLIALETFYRRPLQRSWSETMKTMPSCNTLFTTFKHTLTALAIPCLLAACGGGTGNGPTTQEPEINESRVTVNEIRTGRFLDSAVANIQYRTESLSGLTDFDGTFHFRLGETISFYVGDVLVGTVTAADIITPATLAMGMEHPDALANILRFLQGLDADASPDNGIHIPEAAHDQASGVDVNFSTAWSQFEVQSSLTQLLGIATSNPTLPELAQSLIHFRETLLTAYSGDEEGILDLVNTRWQANLTSRDCPDASINLRHVFNLMGHATTGFHDIAPTEDGSCKGQHWAIYAALWENEPLFDCARNCSFADLNKSVAVSFPRPHQATLIHEPGTDLITIIRQYEDGGETIETLVKI